MCMCERERETVCWHDLMRRAKSNYLPSRGISELTQLAAIRPQVSKNICTHAHARACTHTYAWCTSGSGPSSALIKHSDWLVLQEKQDDILLPGWTTSG